uniref:Uncharacterized protein n=1 Tax=Pan troglodytes TaxID=9598 RepID=H2R8Z7_PANTR
RFGACYKQPLKPSGSEPSAEECRMTPRHAGCDVTEMQRILSQPTFTEHLLRAVCLVNGKGSLSRPQDSVLGSLARKNLRRIHRVSLVMCVRPLSPSAIISPVTCMYTSRWPEASEESQKK